MSEWRLLFPKVRAPKNVALNIHYKDSYKQIVLEWDLCIYSNNAKGLGDTRLQ